MAIQTGERDAAVKDENVNTPVVPAPNKIKRGHPEPFSAGNVEEENEIMAKAETLSHPQPTIHRYGLLGKLATHICRDMLAAFLAGMKRSDRQSTSIRRSTAVGVLPADWEYLTNVAARTQGDVWIRLIIGRGARRLSQ